ncbi:MAG: heat-inducible transcriptional repressor HrcA [Chloroflexota bacterium]
MTNRPDSAQFPELDPRAQQVLGAVIREYIATAEPVASTQLVRGYKLDVSPATVRNELAALEDAGLLTHPHTSAGRVPTDLGYRYFIETLMPSPSLRTDEQVTVSHQFQQALQDTAAWLRVAASSLARLTSEASIVTPPASKRTTLRHVEVVPIHERRALLVAVVDGGAVRQQVLELGTATTADQLRTLSTRLTESLGGATATKVHAAVAAEKGADADIARALARILEEYDTSGARELYVDGFQNIMAQPEFAESDRSRAMLSLFEDHTRLAEILPLDLGDGEVHITIGREHRHESLRDCSLVIGRYGATGDVVGFVGVVGPTRMDYARSIGAVRYVGSLMSDLVRVMEGR